MTSPLVRAAAAALALLALAIPVGVPAGEPSVDASLTIAAPVLPSPKQGYRDLVAAFGKAPAEPIRAEIAAELRSLEAFRELKADGGDCRLEVSIGAVRQEVRRLGGKAGETPDQLEVSLEGEWAWVCGETPRHVAPVTLSRQHPMDEGTHRGEVHEAFRGLIREATERAFSSYYEATHAKASRGGRSSN